MKRRTTLLTAIALALTACGGDPIEDGSDPLTRDGIHDDAPDLEQALDAMGYFAPPAAADPSRDEVVPPIDETRETRQTCELVEVCEDICEGDHCEPFCWEEEVCEACDPYDPACYDISTNLITDVLHINNLRVPYWSVSRRIEARRRGFLGPELVADQHYETQLVVVIEQRKDGKPRWRKPFTFPAKVTRLYHDPYQSLPPGVTRAGGGAAPHFKQPYRWSSVRPWHHATSQEVTFGLDAYTPRNVTFNFDLPAFFEKHPTEAEQRRLWRLKNDPSPGPSYPDTPWVNAARHPVQLEATLTHLDPTGTNATYHLVDGFINLVPSTKQRQKTLAEMTDDKLWSWMKQGAGKLPGLAKNPALSTVGKAALTYILERLEMEEDELVTMPLTRAFHRGKKATDDHVPISNDPASDDLAKWATTPEKWITGAKMTRIVKKQPATRVLANKQKHTVSVKHYFNVEPQARLVVRRGTQQGAKGY